MSSRVRPARHQGPDPLRLFRGELEAAGVGSVDAHDVAQALSAPRAQHAPPKQHSFPRHRTRLGVGAPTFATSSLLAEEKTAANTGMLFNIALNYGGRAEIVEAVKRLMASGAKPEELDEQRFAGFLYTAGQPDPDLLIRTSGEMRVSNFLLWQIAYAEIWVTDTLWPDFRKRHLLEAVLAYQKRDRRYGGIKHPAIAGREHVHSVTPPNVRA